MRSSTFESKSLHSQNSLCGPLNLNSGLTQIRDVELSIQTFHLFLYSIERNRFGKNLRLTWALQTLESIANANKEIKHH